MIADAMLCAAIIAVALGAILARRAFTAVALFVAHGLLLAFAWVRLAAPDIALTEAAIGAGLSGVLLVGAARRLRAPPADAGPGRLATLLIGLGCAVVTAGLAAAILLLPDPAPSLAAAVAAELPAGIGNPVTAVLMTFRGIDTLLEAAVVLLAVVCVWALAPEGVWGGPAGAPQPVQPHGPLALLARLLPPIGIVVAVHILWVGKDAPGGKFQAAAILAAMWLLPWMAGIAAAPRIDALWLRRVLAAGSALFIAIGLLGLVTEGAFLAWPSGWMIPLILLVEFVLTASIAVALALLVTGPPEPGP